MQIESEERTEGVIKKMKEGRKVSQTHGKSEVVSETEKEDMSQNVEN